MGFCSGTRIFDPVAKVVLGSSLPDDQKYDVIYALVDALEDADWDCQDDSHYIDHPIMQKVMVALHPEWGDEDDE